MNKTQTENLQLKNNSQMTKALKYVNWVLLGFNILAIIYLFKPDQSFTKTKNIIIEFYNQTDDFWENGIAYIYPTIWFIFFCIRVYHKIKLSNVGLINALFFIIALLYLCLINFPSFYDEHYIY